MKAVIGIIVVSLIALFIGMSFNKDVSEQIIEPDVDLSDAQVVSLGVDGANYVLKPSVLKKGVPVKLVGSSLPGCSRSVVIPDFGVKKVFSGVDDFVVFVPDKTGKFNIACSMNMYQGSFSVV